MKPSAAEVRAAAEQDPVTKEAAESDRLEVSTLATNIKAIKTSLLTKTSGANLAPQQDLSALLRELDAALNMAVTAAGSGTSGSSGMNDAHDPEMHLRSAKAVGAIVQREIRRIVQRFGLSMPTTMTSTSMSTSTSTSPPVSSDSMT